MSLSGHDLRLPLLPASSTGAFDEMQMAGWSEAAAVQDDHDLERGGEMSSSVAPLEQNSAIDSSQLATLQNTLMHLQARLQHLEMHSETVMSAVSPTFQASPRDAQAGAGGSENKEESFDDAHARLGHRRGGAR